jgi:hypothetical protein
MANRNTLRNRRIARKNGTHFHGKACANQRPRARRSFQAPTQKEHPVRAAYLNMLRQRGLR